MKRPDQIKKAPDQGFGDRVPPGQFVSKKFPVLTYGPTPKIELDRWRLRLFGLVEEEAELDWQQFKAMSWTVIDSDFHCVTQWSSLDNTWEGVLFSEVLKLVTVRPQAKHIMAHCYGGYTTNVAMDVLLEGRAMLAHKQNSQELEGPRLACQVVGTQQIWVEERQVAQRHRVYGGG